MKLPGHKLIKELAKKRELSLGEAVALIHRQFNDHRDFYVVSKLYAEGFVGANLSGLENAEGNDDQIAKIFYAMSLEKGETSSDGLAPIKGLGMSDKLIFHCTAKADIYLAELRKTRIAQLVTLVTGIVITIVSTILAICVK